MRQLGHGPRFERDFVVYGVRITVRADCRALFDALDDPAQIPLPFGWHPGDHHGLNALHYELLTCATSEATPSYRVLAGTSQLAEVRSLTEVGTVLGAHADLCIAERAPEHLFVHAGVVGWEGRAIVMPGASFAGKTTLVRAWLEAGATYYSDEFAVLDRAGCVHPFARPLAVRDGIGATRQVPAATLGAETGSAPLPVGLILVTSYRAGAHWRPRSLTAGPTLLALMRNTVAARGNPEHSMPILKQAVSGSLGVAGVRGEARPLIAAVLGHRRLLMSEL